MGVTAAILATIGLPGGAERLEAQAGLEFAPAVSYDIPGSVPKDTAVGDFDEDGHVDLVVTTQVTDSPADGVAILLGDGTGIVDSDGFDAGSWLYGIATADFDADGHLDLAVTIGTSTLWIPDIYCGSSTGTIVFLGDGTGSFTYSECLTGSNFPISVVAEDLDGDGVVDLAVAHNTGGGLHIHHGFGDGTFAAGEVVVGSGVAATDLEADDFDGDGDLDLVCSNYDGVITFVNDGSGNFTIGGWYGSTYLTQAVATGDIDGDGVKDLASIEIYNGNLNVELGDGSGGFTFSSATWIGTWLNDVVVSDLDLDGLDDIVVTTRNTNEVAVLRSLGGGVLSAPVYLGAGVQPESLAIADLDEDGFGDITVSDRNYGDTPLVSVLLNLPSAPPPPLFRRGDCNPSGVVDIADAIFGLAFLFGSGGPVPCQSACDTNDDGAVDVADMVGILSYLFSGAATPPAPFGTCGLDPTADSLICSGIGSCP